MDSAVEQPAQRQCRQGLRAADDAEDGQLGPPRVQRRAERHCGRRVRRHVDDRDRRPRDVLGREGDDVGGDGDGADVEGEPREEVVDARAGGRE